MVLGMQLTFASARYGVGTFWQSGPVLVARSKLKTSNACCAISANLSNPPNAPRLVTRRTSDLRCCGSNRDLSRSFHCHTTNHQAKRI